MTGPLIIGKLSAIMIHGHLTSLDYTVLTFAQWSVIISYW